MTENDTDLQKFAEHLTDALPKMTPESLARVKEQMDAEMDRSARRRTRRRVLFGCGVAAAVLAALVSYVVLRPGRDIGPALGLAAPAVVRDRVQIVFSETSPSADVGKPVVVLEEYRSLYAD